MKKILLLGVLISVSCLFVGCSIKQKQTTNEYVEDKLSEQKAKEEELLSQIVMTEEENQLLKENIQENIQNNVESKEIKDSYLLSNPYQPKVVEVFVDNVVQNYSTEGDYDSLWLAVEDKNADFNKGLFYSFIDGETNIEFIKQIAQTFSNTPIKEVKVTKVEVETGKVSIKETYKIVMTDELGVHFYGVAYVAEYADNNRILCVDIAAFPEQILDVKDEVNHFSNIVLQ